MFGPDQELFHYYGLVEMQLASEAIPCPLSAEEQLRWGQVGLYLAQQGLSMSKAHALQGNVRPLQQHHCTGRTPQLRAASASQDLAAELYAAHLSGPVGCQRHAVCCSPAARAPGRQRGSGRSRGRKGLHQGVEHQGVEHQGG